MDKGKQRILMRVALTPQNAEKFWEYRTVSQKDREALGSLMLEAYRETIDYEGETLTEACQEIQNTFEGKNGAFLPSCSFLIERNDHILSACLITFYEKMNMPLVAYMMTHPEYQNLGMGTFLLKTSINALLDSGYGNACLVVTKGNDPAYHLYEKLGFSEED
ncbi:MAG: GNAT family N-acetyltransferase [Theionarchaea archaeon]|nr:GNAT family N-acetyltransferase [Theionarchaea archaeon]